MMQFYFACSKNLDMDISDISLSLQSSFQPALIGKPLLEANISNAMIISIIDFSRMTIPSLSVYKIIF
jgi:hypothetical protein